MGVMARETIKAYTGIILGYLDTEPNGDVAAKDSYGKILGYYRKGNNVTTDSCGRPIYQGNCAVALVILKANR